MKKVTKYLGPLELTFTFGKEAPPRKPDTRDLYYSQNWLDYAVSLGTAMGPVTPNIFVSTVLENGKEKEVFHTGYEYDPLSSTHQGDAKTPVWSGKISDIKSTRPATAAEIEAKARPFPGLHEFMERMERAAAEYQPKESKTLKNKAKKLISTFGKKN